MPEVRDEAVPEQDLRAALSRTLVEEGDRLYALALRVTRDPDLAADAVQEATGYAPRLPSGPLHDAVEMARVMPAVMMFARSTNGLSHCKEEDTPESHLERTIRAFLRLVDKTVAHVAAS